MIYGKCGGYCGTCEPEHHKVIVWANWASFSPTRNIMLLLRGSNWMCCLTRQEKFLGRKQKIFMKTSLLLLEDLTDLGRTLQPMSRWNSPGEKATEELSDSFSQTGEEGSLWSRSCCPSDPVSQKYAHASKAIWVCGMSTNPNKLGILPCFAFSKKEWFYMMENLDSFPSH